MFKSILYTAILIESCLRVQGSINEALACPTGFTRFPEWGCREYAGCSENSWCQYCWKVEGGFCHRDDATFIANPSRVTTLPNNLDCETGTRLPFFNGGSYCGCENGRIDSLCDWCCFLCHDDKYVCKGEYNDLTSLLPYYGRWVPISTGSVSELRASFVQGFSVADEMNRPGERSSILNAVNSALMGFQVNVIEAPGGWLGRALLSSDVSVSANSNLGIGLSVAAVSTVGSSISQSLMEPMENSCTSICELEADSASSATMYQWVVTKVDGKATVQTCNSRCRSDPGPPQCPVGQCADPQCNHCQARTFSSAPFDELAQFRFPTMSPVVPTLFPSTSPTKVPSTAPSWTPTRAPSLPPNARTTCFGPDVLHIDSWSQLKNACGKLEWGTLPESIGQLSNLMAISLSRIDLKSLPESFGQLSKLTFLSLNFLRLKTLPESFGQLTSLAELSLDGNQLQSLPESFGQLMSLSSLSLYNNQLQSLPESFGQLTSLAELSLNINQLQSLPESFGQLMSLSSLSLDRNQLKSLPESFGQLTSLSLLSLNDNQLQSLPDSIGQLTGLDKLHLDNNQLKSLPDSIGQLTGLKELHLNNNQLISLPDSFGQVTSLTYLYLDANQLQSLPESFGQLTSLSCLHLNDNQLQSLPEYFGQLTTVTRLSLNNNQLQSLPESFGQLTSLAELSLNGNQLQSLPESFGQHMSLSSLSLHRNQLQSLPESFGQLTSLAELSLFNNQLQSLPESFGQLTSLSLLSLNDNQLQSLPDSIGQLTGLDKLHLDNNQLKSLPDSIGQLTGLKGLHLNNNQLISLPDSFGQVTSLTYLYLDANQLQSLPESFGQLTSLSYLHLNDNQLKSLPDSFGQLTELWELYLDANQLQALPESFGQLTSLTKLTLHRNVLHTLPKSFSQLADLYDLNLSHNQISSLENLSRGRRLDASNNLITRLSPELVGWWRLYIHNNPFHCDRSSFDWMNDYEDYEEYEEYQTFLSSLTDDVQCGSRNEFWGVSLRRLQFSAEEPWTHPILNETISVSSQQVFVSWSFDTEPNGLLHDIHQDDEPYFDSFDCSPRNFQNESQFLWEYLSPDSPLLVYQVEWRRAGEVSNEWSSSCTVHSSFIIQNLSKFVEYDIRVRAAHLKVKLENWDQHYYDEDDLFALPYLIAGPRTPIVQVKTKPDVPEGAPGNVVQVPERTRETSLTFRWNPPPVPNSGNISYTIRMDQEDIIADNVRETTYTVDGRAPDSKFTLQVRACSEVGPGDWSEPIEVWTEARCPPGTHRLDIEGYPCELCPFDMYRSDVETRECLKCPADRPNTLSLGSVSVESCLDGSSFLEMSRADENEAERRTVRGGFWRISNETLEFQKCPNPAYCRPETRALAGSWSSSDQYCRTGHTGVFCASCKSGFALKASGCQECSASETRSDRGKVSGWLGLGVVLVLGPSAWLLFRLYRLSSSHVGKRESKREESSKRRAPKSGWRSWMSENRSRAKATFERYGDCRAEIDVAYRIFLGFYQVFSQYRRGTGLALPEKDSADAVTEFDVSVVFKLQDVGCAWYISFYDALLLHTLSPLVSIAFMSIVVAIALPDRKRFACILGTAVWLTLQLLLLVYPGVSSKIFMTFIYAEFHKSPEDVSPNRTLLADYTINFDSGESRAWRVYAGFMVLIYPVGALALFCSMVWFRRKVLRKDERSLVEAAVSESVEFLSQRYKWAYFESYELMRKLLLTSVFLVVQQESRAGGELYFLIMCIVFLCAVLGTKPYKSWTTFLFATFSCGLLVVAGIIPLALRVLEGMSREAAEGAMTATLVLECVGFGGMVFYNVWQTRRVAQKGATSQIVRDDASVSPTNQTTSRESRSDRVAPDNRTEEEVDEGDIALQ